jgi:hypothetical protein
MTTPVGIKFGAAPTEPKKKARIESAACCAVPTPSVKKKLVKPVPIFPPVQRAVTRQMRAMRAS